MDGIVGSITFSVTGVARVLGMRPAFLTDYMPSPFPQASLSRMGFSGLCYMKHDEVVDQPLFS